MIRSTLSDQISKTKLYLMQKRKFSIVVLCLAICNICFAQNIPILSYSVNSFDQVQLEIDGDADKYYILTALHAPNLDYETITSLTLGQDGTMFISEPAGAFPVENYKITAYDIADPVDTDGDGVDDITELNNMPIQAPLNFARVIPFNDGAGSIPTQEAFSDLGVVEDVSWAPFLNDKEFVKFAIVNPSSDEAEVYFINSNTHSIHANFLQTIDVDQFGDDVTTGEIVYNPNTILSNGAIGSYDFNFSFGNATTFANTRETFELLIRNMPYLQNSMQHFIGGNSENTYLNQYQDDYEGSRINVVLESVIFADIDFIPFNQAEGFGFFKQMTLDENPGSRDIVLYDVLPNSLPRVGGIITSVVQTPLSHVNLRAIQDNAPNAYIKEPQAIDSIANLIGKYIYYKVTQEEYFIREASLEEVNDWYEKLRPTEAQIPDRDLSFTSILPLDEITFDMSTAFGAKCTNVATMRSFGFPEGTIPDGFGIPFYFYDEFMKFNGFYDKAETMITDPTFLTDLEARIDMLKDFRKEIKDADMPQWMLDELQAMHDSFPEGTSVRCRSSTNNEDLPGFSGAGLYTSKTQHPDEGHISKSVKQVYASMWNFRAYDERDFYRVDQYIAAMGLLCHPNFEEEKSNGVGVSIDPIYQTDNTFYLNTQVGEFLITNPDANSIPEEILLSQDVDGGYFVLRNSNLVADGELVMEDVYLDQMREYLGVIHDKFEVLYNVVGAEGFGMDIEYKVTAQDQLIIKQARPWVSFWAEIKSNFDLAVEDITDPISSAGLSDEELVTAKIANRGLRVMSNFEVSLLIDDTVVETIMVSDELNPQSTGEYQFTIPQDFSTIGDYNLSAIVSDINDGYAKNDTFSTVLSKLHLLEGQLRAGEVTTFCGGDVEIVAKVKNLGESTFSDTQIEVIVNGTVVDLVMYDFNIPYQSEVNITINITENLQAEDNEITLNLKTVNGQEDAINTNNSATVVTNLNTEYDYVSLIINADDFSYETSWEVIDESTNQLIAAGGLASGLQLATEDICVNYNSCYSLYFYDSAGDGICCTYGLGNFLMVNAMGDTLFTNDGQFGSQTQEMFCPNTVPCTISAQISTTVATGENIADGTITIITSNGMAPYTYSIDGGATFVNTNTFTELLAGSYMIVVQDASGNCNYEETIQLEFNIIDATTDLLDGTISAYPNPAKDNITIELNSDFHTSNDIIIEIYNNLGLLIETNKIARSTGASKTIISLEEYAPGTYIAKCSSPELKGYFKLIKI